MRFWKMNALINVNSVLGKSGFPYFNEMTIAMKPTVSEIAEMASGFKSISAAI